MYSLNNKVILFVILFTYSFVSFGVQGIEEELPDTFLKGKPVMLVFHQSQIPNNSQKAEISFNSESLGLMLKCGYFGHTNELISVHEGLLTDSDSKKLELPTIQCLLTRLLESQQTSLKIGNEPDGQLYQLNYLSIIQASQAHNQAVAQQAPENGYESVKISQEQIELLENINKLPKNKSSKFPLACIAIPVVMGGGAVLLVGPAIVIANIAVLCNSLLAIGISLTAGVFAFGSTVVISIGGILITFTTPFLIIRDIFTRSK